MNRRLEFGEFTDKRQRREPSKQTIDDREYVSWEPSEYCPKCGEFWDGEPIRFNWSEYYCNNCDYGEGQTLMGEKLILQDIMIILDGYHTEAFSFTLDVSTFWAFMAFTVGGSAAFGILTKMRKQ